MTAYLIAHPPAVRQWYDKRNRALTGCTVLHTAEGVLDTIGPDTGAENTADFIRRRTTAGSYHDLVDSDTWVPLIPYQHGAFHDGTGSNNWALSISFACRTSDWRAMSPEKRRAFLRQGARAFAAQQAWRRASGFPTTELRLISKAQSDAGLSGFIYHGLRDPGRRTDPGVVSPNLFPFDEWLAECRAALAGTTTEEDDLDATQAAQLADVAQKVGYLAGQLAGQDRPTSQGGGWKVKDDSYRTLVDLARGAYEFSQATQKQVAGLQAAVTSLSKTVAALAAGDDVDVDALAARLGEAVRDAIATSTVSVDVNVAGRTV